ncbi:MAG: efflux RND transporter periplasmic adaptor subunit, partial [Bryobacteraceae bacterium]
MELSLPGNVQAIIETPIYARADGYVRRRLADIGDRVRPGQLLAEIESPELDEQIREAEANLRRARSSLEQSRAALQQARAQMELAKVTAQRWQTLVAKGVLPRQEGDEKQAAYLARQADVAAAEAAVHAAEQAVAASESNLQRLLELRSLRQVRAPFAGVITARNVDVGALVTVGSSSAVREMFRLAQIHVLRVQVMIPQSEAPLIRVGLPCELHVEELGERRVPGVVKRTANALDPASRTLLTEVQVENADGRLLPGMYATVHFRLQRPRPPLLIPSSACRNTEKGPVVAVVQPDATVRVASVRLGRDYGTQLEVLSG